MRLGQDLPALKSDDRVVIIEFSQSQEKEREWVGNPYLCFIVIQKIGGINLSATQKGSKF